VQRKNERSLTWDRRQLGTISPLRTCPQRSLGENGSAVSGKIFSRFKSDSPCGKETKETFVSCPLCLDFAGLGLIGLAMSACSTDQLVSELGTGGAGHMCV